MFNLINISVLIQTLDELFSKNVNVCTICGRPNSYKTTKQQIKMMF